MAQIWRRELDSVLVDRMREIGELTKIVGTLVGA